MVKPFSPTEPCLLGDLTIDYVERRVTVGGTAGAVDRHRVPAAGGAIGPSWQGSDLRGAAAADWDMRMSVDLRPLRSPVKSIRRKLGDDAKAPAYIFNEPRVGYRMPKGDPQELVEP